ncbi:MAG: glycosyltransferase WbuB [Neisseriaceae bacterium]|nr:MAG: glycosyltransferase WbuB [Neisseriaceae bacterium]
MNILYINHYAGSIYHGMEYRPYYLSREWVKSGHNVTIFASNLSHIRQKNIDIPRNKNYTQENIDGIEYVWFKTSNYQENGIKRVINIASFINKVWNLHEEFTLKSKPDIVIASSTYPFDTLVAKEIARKYNAKFVYEVHDLWPLTPIEVGGMSKWHPFIMAMQWAENYGYRNADKVVSLLPKADQYMREHGMSADKFVYISNGVAVDDWLNNSQSLDASIYNKITQIKNGGKFILGYAGGMGESNALTCLLQAMKQLSDKPIALVLAGDGALRNELEQYAKSNNLNNIYFVGSILKLQIPSFLKMCDGLYIGWNKLPIYRFGICPNKLFDYMLSCKPIIHSVNAGNDLVKESNCGLSIDAENVNQIADAITKLSQTPQNELDNLAKNGFEFVQKHHDYKHLASRFLTECI